MTLLLKQVFQFLKLLNSETGTNQIAAGIAVGFILGLSPVVSLQAFFVFLLIFFFRIQAAAAFGSAFFFKFVAFVFDPALDVVGRLVLENTALVPLWTSLYHMPIIPFTKFNHSIVMGSGVTALALSPIVFLISKVLVVKYRVTIVARFKETRFWKLVKATRFYGWYAKVEEFRSGG